MYVMVAPLCVHRCAFRVQAACRQHLTHAWSKVWPPILIWAYLIWNFAVCTHIWSTNINFRPSLHWTFWSVLVWAFTLWVIAGGEGGGLSLGHVFVTDRNVTTWVATKNKSSADAEIAQRASDWMPANSDHRMLISGSACACWWAWQRHKITVLQIHSFLNFKVKTIFPLNVYCFIGCILLNIVSCCTSVVITGPLLLF